MDRKPRAVRIATIGAEQVGRACLKRLVQWIQQLRRLKPDLILVVSWSFRIPPEVLSLPRLGCVGLHRFIRALAPPYPSAYTHVAGRKLTIPSAELKGRRLWIEGYIE